jgi:hypothetical protein
MPDLASLLPPNASATERALEAAGAPTADPAPLGRLYAPEAIPARLLPWLAWSWDAPWWHSLLDAREKRALLAGSLAWHKRAGTLSAYRDVGRWAGCEVLLARTRRPLFFAARISEAERRARLAVWPEILHYPYRRSGLLAGLVCGAHLARPTVASTAGDRVGLTAAWREGGQETPLAVVAAGAVLEARRPGCLGRGAAAGLAIGRHLVESGAAGRLYRYTLVDQPGDGVPNALRPALDAGQAAPEHRRLAGQVRGGHVGLPLRHPCMPSTAGDRLVTAIRVIDPTRRTGGAIAFAGRGAALPLDPHTAHLNVRVRGQLAPGQAGGYLVGKFGRTGEAARRVARAREALDRARSARDHVDMIPHVSVFATASALWKAGDILCGHAVIA